MKKVIWKFDLKIKDIQTIEIPKGYEILSIQTQFNNPVLWALVNPDNEKEKLEIGILGTGTHIKKNDNRVNKDSYLGTFQVDDGNFVFHVFNL